MADSLQIFPWRKGLLRPPSTRSYSSIAGRTLLCIFLLGTAGCTEETAPIEEPTAGIQPIQVQEDIWAAEEPAPEPPPEKRTPEERLKEQRKIVAELINPLEDSTEAFVHILNNMSDFLRLGDLNSFSDYFHTDFMGTPFPIDLPPLVPEYAWVESRSWKVESTPKALGKEKIKKTTKAFLAHLPVLESVRFKVSESTWDAPRLKGKIHFKFSGRNKDGQREWFKGDGKFVAHPVAADLQRWELDSLQWTSIRSWVAKRDLFDEVTAPAGLQTSPPDSPGGGLMAEMEAMSQAFNGTAVTDLDGDGFVDLLVCGKEGNRLYINQGNGTFQERSQEVGLGNPFRTSVAAAPLFIDVDNDGDQDLFISGTASSVLYENRLVPDGKLVFIDVTAKAGFREKVYSYMSVAGDVNGDGYVDIYVTSYNNFPWVVPDNWARATNGIDNLLYLNQKDGTFKEVAHKWGVAGKRWTFAAQMADLDADGDLDIYVANDYGSGSTLYRNEGDRFIDAGAEMGLFDLGAGMGVNVGDYNNDGKLDIHLTNMSSNAGARIFQRFEGNGLPDLDHFEKLVAGNMLFQNQGDGTFEEVSKKAGPFNGGWAWGGGFIDMDNDGWEDLHTPNGFMSGKSINDT